MRWLPTIRSLSVPAAVRCIRAWCSGRWSRCAVSSACRQPRPRMRSATALRLICWGPGAICARFRSCWATPAYRRRSGIHRSRPNGSSPFTTALILGRDCHIKTRSHAARQGGEMDLGLKGKKAIVTGGTRGIGRAIADLLADEGCNLALCARSRAGVDEAVAALAGKGVKAHGGVVDVADTKALRGWVAETAGKFGGLDIFIANVSALAQAMDEDSWRRSLDIDVLGTVAGVGAAIPYLEKSPSGAIVLIGTTGAVESAGAPRPYASVKAALAPYVKALARNLAQKGVRANMVSPGNVYFKGGVWNVLEENNPELFQTMVGRNPMGRMGTPAEVASAVVFLASPRASFITGTNLIVDGALTQRVQF